MSHARVRKLNSWKEIAAHLHRDVRTVARWEKQRGLPVHRVPGARGQVYALTDEIDAWLATGAAADEPAAAAEAAVPVTPAGATIRRGRWRRTALVLASVALPLVAGLRTARVWPLAAPAAFVDIENSDLVARARTGTVVWRHTFADAIRWPVVDPRVVIDDLDADGNTETIAVVARVTSRALDREALHAFDHRGRVLWERQLTDVVRFRDGTFGPPWSSGPIAAVRVNGARRLLWVTHHHTWWPSIVALFDPSGALVSRFVHAGWITSIAEARDGAIVLTGVANAADAEAIAVLDARSWPGAAPQPEGSAHECVDCPPGRPVRYYLLPRSELNVHPDALRPPAAIHVHASGTQVRMPQAEGPQPPEVIYDLGRDYDLRSVRRSDSYAAWHRRLETSGALRHPFESCPERGAVRVRQWDRDRGWSDRLVAPR